MDQADILHRISELEREIAALSPGLVSAKNVNGREYFYHRFTAVGMRNEIYVGFDAVDELRAQIERRKSLEAEKSLCSSLTS